MSQYIQLTVSTPAENEEFLTNALFEAGAGGVAVEDPAVIKAHMESDNWDASVFDEKQVVIGRVILSCTMENDSEGRAAARKMAEICSHLESTCYNWQELPDTDWLSQWKKGFNARPIGEKLWLRPVWDETPVPEQRVAVTVEPGMAFGTGDHATTAMALELLSRYCRQGLRLADLGCGTGILAIAGKLLGSGETLAVDIDPVCEKAVAEHCAMNSIPETEIPCIIGDVAGDSALQQKLAEKPWDLITANITANIICLLLPVIPRLLKKDGILLCSGVLEQFHENILQKAAEVGSLELVEQKEEKGWMAYAFRRTK